MPVSTVRSLDGTKSTRDSKEESSLFPVQGRRTASPHSKGEGGEGAQPITALLFLRTIKYFSHGPNLSMLMIFFAEWGEDMKLSSFSINICLRWLRYQHKAIEWGKLSQSSLRAMLICLSHGHADLGQLLCHLVKVKM